MRVGPALCAIVLTWSVTSQSRPLGDNQTPISRAAVIAAIEKNYLTEAPARVVIVDRDELEWRFATARAYGESQAEQRARIVRDFIHAKSAVELDVRELASLDPLFTTLRSQAFAFPFSRGVCIVLPAQANSNRQLETERLVGLSSLEAKPPFEVHHLTRSLTYRESWLFSLFHELSHCLDTEFMPEAVKSNGTDAHAAHQSEAFAETLALLLLAKEGLRDLGPTRATLRSIYSQTMGRHLARNPGLSFGIEAMLHAGAVYFLAPVIMQAHALIQSQAARIESASLNELRAMAEAVVKEHALSSRTMAAIFTYLTSDAAATLAWYDEKAKSYPDLFAESSRGIRQFHEQTELAMRHGLDLSRSASPPNPVPMLRFRIEAFCPFFESQDRLGFVRLLNSYRENLEREPETLPRQRAQAEELLMIYEALPSKCLPPSG